MLLRLRNQFRIKSSDLSSFLKRAMSVRQIYSIPSLLWTFTGAPWTSMAVFVCFFTGGFLGLGIWS